MPSITEDTARSEYVAGLRALADALEQRPELPLPYHGGRVEALVFCDGKAEIAEWARLMTGEKQKRVDEGSEHYGFELHGAVHGFRVNVLISRGEVCRRIVTGTRVETKTEDITEVTGTREVEVQVEDVEWVCEPLLAEATR